MHFVGGGSVLNHFNIIGTKLVLFAPDNRVAVHLNQRIFGKIHQRIAQPLYVGTEKAYAVVGHHNIFAINSIGDTF